MWAGSTYPHPQRQLFSMLVSTRRNERIIQPGECEPYVDRNKSIIVTFVIRYMSSIFNMREVDVLVQYVELLMKDTINGQPIKQKDIGIISPYRKQVIFCKTIHSLNIFKFLFSINFDKYAM